jgi:2-polyprenyl-3-methyl-5-hydroxy-6-metoxy-1,4-benzoquinol methylase
MSIADIQTNKGQLQHQQEVSTANRFEFGKNWRRFLELLDEERISVATESLRTMLGVDTLEGKTFLDIGSGSGLFSLAARRLGAKVFSFDFDPDSVACGLELKKRYFSGDADWHIEHGSILDRDYILSLGKFDIIYSWGVLHHTGHMWEALENASLAVAESGKIFIAIYNDTGSQADRWKWIKKTYCRLPKPLKTPFAVFAILPDESKRIIRSVLDGDPLGYLRYWRQYRNDRGMDRWRDIIDWVGGYPYEYAGVTEIFDFFKAKGFQLKSIKSDGVGLGCNEFVFERSGEGVVTPSSKE